LVCGLSFSFERAAICWYQLLNHLWNSEMFGKLLNSSRNADITFGKLFGDLQKTVAPFWTIVRKLSLIFVGTNLREKTKTYFAQIKNSGCDFRAKKV